MKFTFALIGKLKNGVLIFSTLMLFIIGLVINNYFPTDFFVLKCFLLLSILNILLFSAKHYNNFIVKGFLKVSVDPVLGAEKLKMKNRIFSKLNIFISLLLSFFFVAISVYLGFINFDVTGYISLMLLFVTIFISIIGYILYINLIHFLYRISNADIKKYSKLYPAYTSWLVNITKHSGTYQNFFLISGTFYVILFAIHAPGDTLTVLSYSSEYSFNDLVLSTAWLIIIVAVLIGFPTTSYLRSHVIKTIVSNLKIKSSEYYDVIVSKVGIDKQLYYIRLIKEIMESADYPVKTKSSMIVSSITLAVNLVIAILKVYPYMMK